jgi:PPOX class probable F420-dependent enzyme
MTERIPRELLDLFEKPSLSHLATLMPDGSPHVSPVWVDYDGQYILINTAKGRRKEINMRGRPQVALDIVDPENPFRFLSIRGRVVEMTEEGANEHRDRLDTRYLGITKYPARDPQEIRLICKILPERIMVNH